MSYGGCAVAVLMLSLTHARYVADNPYSFAGSFRFSWAIAYTLLLWIATYAVGLPDQPRNKRQAAWLAIIASATAAIGISIPQLITGDALLPRFVVFGAALALIPWQVGVNGLSRDGRSRAEGRDRVILVAAPEEHVRLTDDLRMEP